MVKLANLAGMGEELIGIGRVVVAEDDGGGSHSGGGFSGEIRPGIAWVDLVSVAVRRHVLRPLPTVMVRVPISHLIIPYINLLLIFPPKNKLTNHNFLESNVLFDILKR